MSLIFIALVLIFMYSHIFDGGVTYIIIFIFISERYRKYLVRNSLFMCKSGTIDVLRVCISKYKPKHTLGLECFVGRIQVACR